MQIDVFFNSPVFSFINGHITLSGCAQAFKSQFRENKWNGRRVKERDTNENKMCVCVSLNVLTETIYRSIIGNFFQNVITNAFDDRDVYACNFDQKLHGSIGHFSVTKFQTQ